MWVGAVHSILPVPFVTLNALVLRGSHRRSGSAKTLRPPSNKAIVSKDEMVDRIKAAVDAR